MFLIVNRHNYQNRIATWIIFCLSVSLTHILGISWHYVCACFHSLYFLFTAVKIDLFFSYCFQIVDCRIKHILRYMKDHTKTSIKSCEHTIQKRYQFRSHFNIYDKLNNYIYNLTISSGWDQYERFQMFLYLIELHIQFCLSFIILIMI